MNMTLQLPDDLCTAAQQRAGVESKTLSSWFTDLLRRELRQTSSQHLGPPANSVAPESSEQSVPMTDRNSKFSPLVIERLPTADRLVELYDEATADYDLPLCPRSEDVSRTIYFP